VESILQFFSHFLEPDPKTALLVVLNLILIESLLSVDNAAVLATMVMDLPEKDRKRALRIGLILAYIFRGTALVFASILIKISWLKLLGGAYLVYLCGHFFYKEIFKHEHILDIEKEELNEGIKHPKKMLGLNAFWSTVIMVEAMDMTFSIDNVFAAVAFTKNIYLVCLGVFIGIITMRIVAGYFVKLMERFSFLDTVAFLVIGILGIKLCLGFYCEQYGQGTWFCNLFLSEKADLFFSLSTVVIFALPILTSVLFGFPKSNKPTNPNP
jgi:YkoY family integral membrane protein